MKKISSFIFTLFFLSGLCFAQTQKSGPYTVRASEVYKSPKKHRLGNPLDYGDKGIIQISYRGSKSFAFQSFDQDLRYKSGNIVNTENLLNDHTNFNGFVKLKNKTYLFVRDVNREKSTEGISALEFSPSKLDFIGKSKSLFQSSDKVRTSYGYFGYYGSVNSASGIGSASSYGYNFVVSNDETSFLFTYSLVPKQKKDALNKDIIGMYAFDENLTKIFGGEFEMPYTEAKMDNLGYTISNDGTVYLLAKVYETDRNVDRSAKDKKPNYRFEVLVYNKTSKTPTKIKLDLDKNFPQEVYIYEDSKSNIVVAGFYSRTPYGSIEGSYLVKFQVKDGVANKVNGDFYPIPNDIIKTFTSEREKKKMDKKQEKAAAKGKDSELGVDNLEINEIYEMPNGSTKIVSEQYRVDVIYYYDASCKCTKTRYVTHADDVFVISIDEGGKQEWVKKIPKAQQSNDAIAAGLSINSLIIGNDLHIFFVDNIKNLKLSPNEAPKMHINGKGGFLTGIKIDAAGKVQKYSLGEINDYKTNFFIRGFVKGEHNNLISSERRKKKNKLISVEVK